MPPESQSQFNPPNNVPAPQTPEPESTFLKRKYFGLYFVLAIVLFTLASVFLLWWINKTSNEITLNSKIILSGPTNHFAGWQTYTNEKYGFEIKYPQDFFLQNSGDNIELMSIPPSSEGLNITWAKEPLNALNAVLSKVKVAGTIVSTSTISVANINAPITYYKAADGYYAVIYLPNNKLPYRIILQGMDGSFNISSVYNQIFSTFKFIPSTSSGQVSTSTKSIISTSTKDYAPCTTDIVKARNIKTGEIRDGFSSTCIPEGWVKVE
jgi:hypothetical protein